MRPFRLGAMHFGCEAPCHVYLCFAVVCKASAVQSLLDLPVNLHFARQAVCKTCHAAELQQQVV